MFKEHPLLAAYPSDPTRDPGLQDTEQVLSQPNTALLSLVLMMGTFFLAFFLRKLRNSRFLGGKVPYFLFPLKLHVHVMKISIDNWNHLPKFVLKTHTLNWNLFSVAAFLNALVCNITRNIQVWHHFFPDCRSPFNVSNGIWFMLHVSRLKKLWTDMAVWGNEGFPYHKLHFFLNGFTDL